MEKNSKLGKERRQGQRKKVNQHLEVRYKKSGWLSFLLPAKKCQVIDFYAGGIGIVTKEPLKKHQPLKIQITYKDANKTRVNGIITHHKSQAENNQRYGIMFLDPCDKKKASLREIENSILKS